MSYFTQAEARRAAQQAIRSSGSASDAIRHAQKNYKDTDRFDIFLSHAMVDAELVLGIKVMLEEEGKKVYVDWIDDQALDRNRVTAATAEVLRQRMRQSESLLYLATENAPKSKWMPWELGYFDGFKNGSVAVLPVMDESDSPFEGQEYLSLYPAISKEELIQHKSKGAARQVLRSAYGLPLDTGLPFDPQMPGLPLGRPKFWM